MYHLGKMDTDDYSEEVEIGDEDIIDILLSAKLFDDNWMDGPLLVSGIHRAVFEGNIHTVKLMVESGVSIDAGDNRHGFTPLHIAVVINNLELVEYLLSCDGVSVDAKSLNNLTALHVASQMGHIHCVRKLVEAGADVNLQDSRGYTPLSISTHQPEVAHFLIENGADVDSVSLYSSTPLHSATAEECLETVCMLLYYNADPDVCDYIGRTPFMNAIKNRNREIQQVLLEYVADFSECDALNVALEKDLTFVREIIKRGGDVNYADYESVDADSSAFNRCLLWAECKREVFKLVWDRISYNEVKNTIDLLAFFQPEDLPADVIENYLQVMVESDNFEPAVESLTANQNYHSFVENFARLKLNVEQLTVFTCRLLEYGYRVTSWDVSWIFSLYGFCELTRILLYMDVDCSKGWPLDSFVPRMLFDLGYKLQESEIAGVKRRVGLRLLKYFTSPELLCKFGKEKDRMVPSLTELARDGARRYIWNSLHVKSTCQFYTAIANLKGSTTLRKILTFEKKLYK